MRWIEGSGARSARVVDFIWQSQPHRCSQFHPVRCASLPVGLLCSNLENCIVVTAGWNVTESRFLLAWAPVLSTPYEIRTQQRETSVGVRMDTGQKRMAFGAEQRSFGDPALC